jgi:transglutaminase-like putative cysteine protease
MKYKVSAQLNYTANADGLLILNIQALRTTQNVTDEVFSLEPSITHDELFPSLTGNHLVRFALNKGQSVAVNYSAIVDNAWKITEYHPSKDVPVSQMDADVLTYLYPSRYCQSDKLSKLADDLFGKINHTHYKVLALVEWIYRNVQYVTGSSTAQISAFETIESQTGVCKDFAHLGIAFCRALEIPARYFTAYAYQLIPQDFHACFEAYVGGEWVLFDPTRLAPLNGLVKISNGRDAADCSVANIFGDILLDSMMVNCELAEEKFDPIYHLPFSHQGVSYL